MDLKYSLFTLAKMTFNEQLFNIYDLITPLHYKCTMFKVYISKCILFR